MQTLIPAMMAFAFTAAPLAVSAQHHDSNFSYSYIGFEVGSADLDQRVMVSNEAYDELGFGKFSAGYQFTDNLAVSLESLVLTNSGPRTEITDSVGTLSLHFPLSFNTVDLVPHVGVASFESEVCERNLCYKDSLSSFSYGVDLRVWAVPDVLELGVGYTDYADNDVSRVVSLEGAIWAWDRHRFSLSYYDRDFSTATTLGYRYNW